MTEARVPRIFSTRRRNARAMRAAALSRQSDAASWLADEMQRDIIERLDFMRFEPSNALVVGHQTGEIARHLEQLGSRVTSLPAIDEEQPIDGGPFDLILTFGRLDTVNDLPGALLHIRNALTPEGLLIAQLVGAGSLTALRRIMLAADGERPSARIHPQIDDRAATSLMQRAGFAKLVIDTHKLNVRYRSLDCLVADLREQALTNVLADAPPPLGKAAFARAKSAFEALKDEEGGRVAETFQILTLTGWR